MSADYSRSDKKIGDSSYYIWRNNDDWKQRYVEFYSLRRGLNSLANEEENSRISFMNYASTPYTTTALRFQQNSSDLGAKPAVASEIYQSDICTSGQASVISPRSEEYGSSTSQSNGDDLGGNGTLLLNMVRARQRELAAELEEKTLLELPKEESDEEDLKSEACMRGIGMRMTDRSVSRSRVSRMSTRRDMDIPSILAYTISTPAPVKVHLEIPAFQNINAKQEEPLRWSIRRSVCPVCSQKWRDRSSVKVVKNSGLKRNSALDLPTVIAPARLRTSITLGYVPRPALAAVDEEAGLSYGGLRNTSASWQLTRARRFRTPKPHKIPSDANIPPCSTAPLARKDLDLRVSRFLNDEV